MSISEDYKLTVVVLTYNHAAFIERCINSILEQDVHFAFRIIISDDYSTDGTQDILRKLAAKAPDKISLLLAEKNRGVLQNVTELFKNSLGEYLAILDGDDYWTEPSKIARQIEFLDNNPTYNGCFHDTEIVHLDESRTKLFSTGKYYSQSYLYKEEVFPWDIVKRLILPTGSLVLRRTSVKAISPSQLGNDNYSIAWKICCLAIRRSKFYYFDKVWSTYRNHKGGISKSGSVSFHSSHIRFLQSLLSDSYYNSIKHEVYDALSTEQKILLFKLKEKPEGVLHIGKEMRTYLYFEFLKTLHFYLKFNAQ